MQRHRRYLGTTTAYTFPNAREVVTTSDPKGYTTQTTCSREETITWDGNGMDKYHVCEHVKDELNMAIPPRPTLTTYSCRAYYNTGIREWTDVDLRYSPNTGIYVYGGPSREERPTQEEINQRIHDAAIRLQGAPIKPMMNLPQAIIELKDIPATLRAASQLGRWIGKLPRAKRALTLSKSVAEVASAYLAYQFGVKPTAHDVSNFMGEIPEKVRLGVRKVQYKRGEPVRAAWHIRPPSYSELENGVHTVASGSYMISGTGWQTTYPFITSGANTTSIASKGETNTVKWPYTDSARLTAVDVSGVVFGRVGRDYSIDIGVLDDIAFNWSPLGTTWELIPFSFVVDWFANIGRFIDQANRLAAARYSGFMLEDGIWFTRRYVATTYRTIAECVFEQDIQLLRNTIGAANIGIMNCGWSCLKRVHFYPQSKHLDFARGPYAERVPFPALQTAGLGSQGAFQWTTGSALAIQAMKLGR